MGFRLVRNPLSILFPETPGRAEKRGGWLGTRNRPLVKHTFPGAMKPLCPLCSTRHEVWQGHVFASNAASNTRSASNNASNDVDIPKARDQHFRGQVSASGGATDGGGIGSGSGGGVGGGVEGSGRSKQRWSRDSYNAYQREYMKVYRAVKSGRAEKVRFA